MKVAVLTQVRNESILLPIWLKYYSKHIDDIYVTNHGGEQDYIDKLADKYKLKKRFEATNRSYDHQGLVSAVKRVFNELLDRYDHVIYTDVDEFLIPSKCTLREYVKSLKKDQYTCIGREVLQVPGEEPIDFEKPLLKQRKYWWGHPAIWKSPISNHPMNWVLGFHYTSEMVAKAEKRKQDMEGYIKSVAEKDLYLVHINKIDYDLLTKRGRYKDSQQERDYEFTKGIEEKEEIPNYFKEII